MQTIHQICRRPKITNYDSAPGGLTSRQGFYWPRLTLVRIKVRRVSHEPSSHQSFPACVRLVWPGRESPSLSCEYIFLILGHQTPGHGPSVNIRIESERWGLHWGEKTLNGLVKCGILPQLLSALSVCFWNFMLENNQPDSTFREGKVEQNAHQLILHSSVSSFSRVVFEKLYSSRWTWTIKGFTCSLYRHQASYMNFIKDLIDFIKAIKIK